MTMARGFILSKEIIWLLHTDMEKGGLRMRNWQTCCRYISDERSMKFWSGRDARKREMKRRGVRKGEMRKREAGEPGGSDTREMDAFAGDRTNDSAMLGSRGCGSPRVRGACACARKGPSVTHQLPHPAPTPVSHAAAPAPCTRADVGRR